MIFRKQPLIDANWLLGPSAEEVARTRSSLQAWIWTFAGAAAIAGAWLVASDLTMRKERFVAEFSNRDTAQIAVNGSREMQITLNTDSGSTATMSTLDESLIRTVDRFVPKTKPRLNDDVASKNIKLEGSKTSASTKLAFDFTKFEVPHNASMTCFDFRDLAVEVKPTIPYELLKNLDTPVENSQAIASKSNGPAVSPSRTASSTTPRTNSREPQSQSPKVVRTVSYKANNSNTGISPLEPPPANSLRTVQPNEVDERNASRVEPDVSPVDESGFLAGLTSRPTGEVVRLLGSIQPRISGAALHELRRREMTDEQIQLALELVSGTIEQRLSALDRLISEQSVAPVPWLVWMAEDQNRQVREHAIRILGSVNHDDSRREMRLLMNREKDEGLRSLLRQLCAASGSNTSR